MYGQVGCLFSECWAKKGERSEVNEGGDMGRGRVPSFVFFKAFDLWWLHLLHFLYFCLVD